MTSEQNDIRALREDRDRLRSVLEAITIYAGSSPDGSGAAHEAEDALRFLYGDGFHDDAPAFRWRLREGSS